MLGLYVADPVSTISNTRKAWREVAVAVALITTAPPALEQGWRMNGTWGKRSSVSGRRAGCCIDKTARKEPGAQQKVSLLVVDSAGARGDGEGDRQTRHSAAALTTTAFGVHAFTSHMKLPVTKSESTLMAAPLRRMGRRPYQSTSTGRWAVAIAIRDHGNTRPSTASTGGGKAWRQSWSVKYPSHKCLGTLGHQQTSRSHSPPRSRSPDSYKSKAKCVDAEEFDGSPDALESWINQLTLMWLSDPKKWKNHNERIMFAMSKMRKGTAKEWMDAKLPGMETGHVTWNSWQHFLDDIRQSFPSEDRQFKAMTAIKSHPLTQAVLKPMAHLGPHQSNVDG
ncbi:hypothetical protein DFP72DRAFT_860358 [Ephemerocybe angulata]|uniref:Retrotransposon gag domain-containing protein n=1 Tax=Ephemerocybe angulata TaxID=980116 RepID=A0A8H6LUE2_9AGAR|nr:hypothetical protein DFP72DRAFT_860358 [Tulosesus angulatus]